MYVRTTGFNNDVGDVAVQGLARARQLFQSLARIGSLQQGTVLVVTGAVQDAADAGAQIDDRATRLQESAALRAEDRPAAGGHDDAAIGGQVANDFLLATTKALFALDLENQWNRGAGTGLNLVIGVKKGAIKSFRQRATDRCLTRTHQTD